MLLRSVDQINVAKLIRSEVYLSLTGGTGGNSASWAVRDKSALSQQLLPQSSSSVPMDNAVQMRLYVLQASYTARGLVTSHICYGELIRYHLTHAQHHLS